MGLRTELQIASVESNAPEQAVFDQCLEVCFGDEPAQSVLIRIVGILESSDLNLQYRNKTGPTNILSFPFDVPPGIPSDHLGDLVICAPLVSSEAIEQGKLVLHHWIHLLIHGVLHLQGFDHIAPKEAQEMESLETKLLSLLDVPDPYSPTK